MARKIKKRAKPCRMVIDNGVLFIIQKSQRVLVSRNDPEHEPYRRAYRRLFGRMGRWPPDGKYEFTGKRMRKQRVMSAKQRQKEAA